MWLIIGLIIIGALLLVAEIVLLPGITVAGVLAFAADVAAVWITFVTFGQTAGIWAIIGIVVLSTALTILSLRAKTWQRLALNTQIDGSSQKMPQDNGIKIGDKGVSVTRLAPSGKASINGHTFEAQSIDSYVDPKTEIEVIGFDNFSIKVRKIVT